MHPSRPGTALARGEVTVPGFDNLMLTGFDDDPGNGVFKRTAPREGPEGGNERDHR